jgi:FlaG/FlaF family flagellin (archaellin)
VKNLNLNKSFRLKHGEEAVSPVVGVMLMLVVTIIIAAVVSGFAGSMMNGQTKAPTIEIETHIHNTGMFTGSGIYMTVKSASDPISTKDVKLVTSWSTTCKNTAASDPGNPTGSCVNVGDAISGGTTSVAGSNNTQFYTYTAHSTPYGVGTGVTTWGLYNFAPNVPQDLFGNYTLIPGTTMSGYPVGPFVSYLAGMGGYGAPSSGATPNYIYSTGALWTGLTQFDSMQAVMGQGWENLRPGDVVHVKLIHIPSGKVIYNADIAVEG